MFFWVGFYSLSVIAVFAAFYVKESQLKYITPLYVFLIFFVSAFRYMIGSDYDAYTEIYATSITSVDELFEFGHEPLFDMLILTLNELGFSAQMLFVVMSGITIYFIYYGVRAHLSSERSILLVLVLYTTFFTAGGYWSCFNLIRQAAAMSILVYAARYIVNNSFLKFLCFILLAMGFHYSAIIFLPFYWIAKIKNSPRSMMIGTIFSLLITVTGVSVKLFLLFIPFFSELYGKYLSAALNVTAGVSGFSFMTIGLYLMFCVCLYVYSRNTVVDKLTMLAFSYMVLRILFSISVEGNPAITMIIHRFEIYFLLFYLIFLVRGVEAAAQQNYGRPFLCCSMMLLSAVFSFLMIYQLYQGANDPINQMLPSLSAGNYRYEFNFRLFQ